MIDSLQSLKNKFRAAVLSGLAALGLMTGCSRAPDTRIEIDEDRSFINIGFGEYSAWPGRQYHYLGNDSNRVHYQAWLAQLDGVKDASLLDKANAVNDLVNKTVTYAPDSVIYNDPAYWASGIEAILTGVGDCEDFSTAKFYALQYLNVPQSRYAILTVANNDTLQYPNHGVLAIDTSAANDWTNCLILDNDEYFFGFIKTGGLETLGETGYRPFDLVDELEIKACRLKTLKPPAP